VWSGRGPAVLLMSLGRILLEDPHPDRG
jgi:hypothetical protein